MRCAECVEMQAARNLRTQVCGPLSFIGNEDKLQRDRPNAWPTTVATRHVR
jgi:hypothetical protein